MDDERYEAVYGEEGAHVVQRHAEAALEVVFAGFVGVVEEEDGHGGYVCHLVVADEDEGGGEHQDGEVEGCRGW